MSLSKHELVEAEMRLDPYVRSLFLRQAQDEEQLKKLLMLSFLIPSLSRDEV